jgi:hypothetical protein
VLGALFECIPTPPRSPLPSLCLTSRTSTSAVKRRSRPMALLRAAGSLAGLTRTAQGPSSALACGRVLTQRALYAAEAAPEAVPDVDGSVTQVRWPVWGLGLVLLVGPLRPPQRALWPLFVGHAPGRCGAARVCARGGRWTGRWSAVGATGPNGTTRRSNTARRSAPPRSHPMPLPRPCEHFHARLRGFTRGAGARGGRANP